MSARFPLPLPLLIALWWCVPCAGAEQAIDYTSLAEPSYADRLGLTDQQRADAAKILDARIAALAAAKPDERAAVLAESNKKLEQLLTEEQKAAFAAMVAGGKLRFDFRQQPWPEVLDWFARQSDLSLVMDTVPPGAFTYSDTKEYTPAEAIDLLNSVLLSKGFTLMRRERMLIVVDVSAGIPFELAPKVSVQELADRGRFEIVTVEFPLGGRPMDTVVDAVQELIGKHGRVTPLTGANKLLVTETAGKLDAINVVISAIPIPKPPSPPAEKPKPPDPVFAAYSVKGLDPQATVQTLEALFAAAKLTADPVGGEIHAYAVPALQESIKACLEKMMASASGGGQPRLEIYPVEADDLKQLPAQLALAVPKAQVTVDESQHRLLVVANADEQAQVQQTLEKLGAAQQAVEGAATVVIYQVDDKATGALETLLKQLLPRALVVSQPGRIAVRGRPDEQRLAQATIDEFQQADAQKERRVIKLYPVTEQQKERLRVVLPDLQSELDIKVTVDTSMREIAVWATEPQHATVAQILEGMRGASDHRDLALHRFPIDVSDPSQLLSLLTQKFPDTQILLNERKDAVLVWEDPEHVEAIKAELDKLVAVLPPVEKRGLETYPVPESEAATILAAVQALAPQAQSSLDNARRHLIVIGSAKDQNLIAELVQKLTPDDRTNGKVLIAYPLKEADSTAVVSMLKELRPDLSFAADARANRVLVTAPLGEQPRVQAVIQQLDAAPDASQEVAVQSYQLKTVNPQTLLSLVQPLFPEMQVTVDAASKHLLASGKQLDHQKLESLIRRIDESDGPAGEVRSYEVGAADVEQLRNVLMQLVPAAVVSANPSAQRVLVWANRDQHSTIQQAIDEFTRQEPDQTRQLQTYPLPERVGSTALTVMQAVAPSSTLSLDASGKQLICWATGAQHQAIQRALESLAQAYAPAADRVLRAHAVRADVADQVRKYIATAVEGWEPVETPDKNTIAGWATEKDHALIEQLVKEFEDELKRPRPRTLAAYELQSATAASATTVLNEALPNLTFLNSPSPSRLLVLATEEQHVQIGQILDELDKASLAPQTSLRVYPIDRQRMAAQTVVDALTADLAKNAVIQVNQETNSLIIRARDADHARLTEAIKALMDQLPTAQTSTQVYRFTRGSPSSAMTVLASLVPQARMAADDKAGTLAATATQADQERIRTVVEQIEATEPNSGYVTQVYPLKLASPQAVQEAIKPLVGNGSVVADEASGSLVVTASQADHQHVTQVVEQLDAVPGQQPVVRAYPIRHADADALYDTISQSFMRRSRDFFVTYQPATSTFFVVATPRYHEVFQQLIRELDQPEDAGQPRTAKVYTLTNVDTAAAASALRALFRGQKPNVEVEANSRGNTLVVVANGEQHVAVEEALRGMEGEPRELEVFELFNTDPVVVEQAIFDLFADVPAPRAPSVSSDYSTQKLFVRGTKTQIEQIRQLLMRLGESLVAGTGERQTGDVRTIPFRGDALQAVRQIMQVWPRLRTNRIQIVAPSDRRETPLEPSAPAQPQNQEGDSIPDSEPGDESKTSSADRTGLITRFVAVQDSVRTEPPREAQPPGDEPVNGAVRGSPDPSAVRGSPDPAQDATKPPVLIVPDEGKITIVSSDHEALDQLEAMLRAMARSESGFAGGPDFAVYMLRNTGAGEVQLMLRQLFDELPVTRGGLGDVVVVADERLNALIVYGTRKARQVVEELLEVLDTSELPDPLVAQRPELIPVKNTEARRVLAILENVYRTQLTSGGGRRPIQIPKGVSAEVASVLQQLNAATSGPIMTLDVDEATNSIVMRAPPELSREVRSFVEQLDRQADDSANHQVRVIRLQQSKADRMQAVLEQFILESSPRRTRTR